MNSLATQRDSISQIWHNQLWTARLSGENAGVGGVKHGKLISQCKNLLLLCNIAEGARV
jgi:hypothetical protein